MSACVCEGRQPGWTTGKSIHTPGGCHFFLGDVEVVTYLRTCRRCPYYPKSNPEPAVTPA